MRFLHAMVSALLLAIAAPAAAELSEINVAQQYGVSFLPLMVMERDKLVEKHAKAAGPRRGEGRTGSRSPARA